MVAGQSTSKPKTSILLGAPYRSLPVAPTSTNQSPRECRGANWSRLTNLQLHWRSAEPSLKATCAPQTVWKTLCPGGKKGPYLSSELHRGFIVCLIFCQSSGYQPSAENLCNTTVHHRSSREGIRDKSHNQRGKSILPCLAFCSVQRHITYSLVFALLTCSGTTPAPLSITHLLGLNPPHPCSGSLSLSPGRHRSLRLPSAARSAVVSFGAVLTGLSSSWPGAEKREPSHRIQLDIGDAEDPIKQNLHTDKPSRDQEKQDC